MSRPIFKHAELDSVFQREGIIQLPFIGTALCDQIAEMYVLLSGAGLNQPFHSTMFHRDASYRRTVSGELTALLNLPAQEWLQDYRILFANFICKAGNGNNAVGLHQDWSMTDESMHRAVNIWVPLTRITPERGAFRAWKGSHRAGRNIRYTPYPANVYREAENLAQNHLDPFYPEAGEALFYDAALLHASDANLHPEPRLAVGMALIPAEAAGVHFFRPDPLVKKLEVFATSGDSYEQITLEDQPSGEPVEQLETFDDFSDLFHALEQLNAQPERKIFVDPELNEAIVQSGYVVLRQVLDSTALEALRERYEQNKPAEANAFAISNWTQSESYRERSHQIIVKVIGELASRYLKDYRPLMGVFAVKQSGEGSAMLMHQDWSLVDERTYTSVSFWCPLQSTNRNNGNLQVVLGSHLDLGGVRGVNVPPPFDAAMEIELRKQRLMDLPMELGDVVVFDHRLIHCSPDNLSGKERVSAVLALVPEEAGVVHFYQEPEPGGGIEILAMDSSEFYRLNFFDHPNRPVHLGKLGYLTHGK